MNRVEERLTAAYRAAAETVTGEMELPDLAGARSVGSVRRAGVPGFRPRAGARASLIRLAGVLAAAAAVAAVAVTLSLISASGPGPSASQSSGPLPWRLPAATSVSQGYPGNRIPAAARPGYFVGMRPTLPTDYAFTIFAYSATAGRPTGQLTFPRPGLWARAVTSLGHRTFLAAATKSWPRFGCRTWLYQFRLTAAGKPTGVKPFVVPVVSGWVQQLAGSADGRTAVLFASKCIHARNQPFSTHDELATAVSLPSGTVTTWSPWPAASSLVPENTVPSTSLDANGRLFPFTAIAGHPLDFGQDTMAAYVMVTGHRGGSVSRRYHLVINPPGAAGALSAVLSPNGRVTFVLTANRFGGRWHEAIGAYATATGKLITVLATASAKYVNGDGFLMPDPSGRYLLMAGFGSGNTAVLDIKTHELSVVPVPYRNPPLAASW